MKRTMNRATVAAVVVALLLAGFGVGQATRPASAQAPAPSTEEKAAAIKAELVKALTEFNESIPPDVAGSLAQVGLSSRAGGNLAVETLVPAYFRNLAYMSQDYPMVGQYVRYLAPAFSAGVVRVPEDLIQHRFLDHFSQAVAATGLPPIFPALTREEVSRVEDRLYYSRPAWKVAWPFGWSAGWLLGVN